MVAHCLCVVLALYFFFHISGIAAQESGPYKINLEVLKNCESKGTGEISVSSVTRKERDGRMYHSGNLHLPEGLHNRMKGVGDASIMKENEWRPIGLIHTLTFNRGCTNLWESAPGFFLILKAADMENMDCPIPKGTYHFKDYRLKDSVMKMKTLRYGKYRIRLSFYKNNRKIGCLCYIANVTPADQ